MSATLAEQRIPSRRSPARRMRAAFRDAMAVAIRNLIGLMRTPQLVVFATIQPIIFVLLFRYVFGGAVELPVDIPYVDYLMPGIFVQTAVFGALGSAIGLAADMKTGLLERFHALPMARSAVLAGRTAADLVRNMFVITLMTVVGFAVGFRVHTDAASLLLGMLLVVLFAYALSWIFATLGLLVRDPEAAQAAAFPVMAPLVFASSAFVPVESMPSWLQPFAENQPVSVVIGAVRALTLPPEATEQLLDASATYYVMLSLAWIAGLLLLFAPIAVWRFRRAV